MPESTATEAILEAMPWRCFHCDFITTSREEAAAHFGDRDDAEEFKPICKWWANMDSTERASALQDVVQQLNEERRDNERLRVQNEGLEWKANSFEGEIRSYKPFRKLSTIYQVFCEYDSMEGRALAAEERLAAIAKESPKPTFVKASPKICICEVPHEPDCSFYVSPKPVCGTCKGTEWVRGTSAYGNGGSVPCPDCKPIVPVTRREETK